MGLSSAGIGSNLDVAGIVSKLMSVEQQPLKLLAKTESSYQAKLSGFGTLKGAMSAFQTAVKGLADVSKFQAVKAAVGDSTIASASASGTAQPGNYSLNVTQLAQAQKLVAGGVASQLGAVGKGVISFDFGTIAGGTLDPGTGKYTGASFTSTGAGIKTVTIDDSNNSLAGIRDAINAANVGVSAKIVNDGGTTPYRLSLTSTATGAAASMKISVADTAPDNGLSALLNHDPAGTQALSQTSAAQNALLTIDGIAVSKASNSVTDVIDGLTLNLTKVSTTPTTIAVTRDTEAVKTSVNAFVKAYNEIAQNLRDAMAYDPKGDRAAVLNGEGSVRAIQSQIRNVLSAPIAGGASTLTTLSQIGVTLQSDGSMTADPAKLDKAIASNFDSLAGLFAASGKASNSLASFTGSTKETKPGSYAVEISQLATMGSTQATAPAGLTIDGTNNAMSVTLNGLTASITLEQKTYANAAALASELQSKINGVAAFSGSSVKVSETGGVLKIVSDKYGSASNISIAETGTANLFFDTAGPNVVPGVDVAGTINGVAASGNGQVLTGATGDPSEGLKVSINGGTIGAFGTVSFSKGYAYQFEQLANDVLSATGSIASRTEGIAASIKGIEKKRADINARLQMVEARYLKQFNALDLTLSKMTTTSTYLSQQLSSLAAMQSA